MKTLGGGVGTNAGGAGFPPEKNLRGGHQHGEGAR